jgi:hypothetical protein
VCTRSSWSRPDADGRSGLPRGRTSTLGGDPEIERGTLRANPVSNGSARAVLADPTR